MTVKSLDTFRLASVQAYIVVFNTGSYSEAARQLGCAQSTVWRSVESLSSFLDGKVFDGDREPKLTALGKAFLPKAVELITWANDCKKLRASLTVKMDEPVTTPSRGGIARGLSRLLKPQRESD